MIVTKVIEQLLMVLAVSIPPPCWTEWTHRRAMRNSAAGIELIVYLWY